MELKSYYSISHMKKTLKHIPKKDSRTSQTILVTKPGEQSDETNSHIKSAAKLTSNRTRSTKSNQNDNEIL